MEYVYLLASLPRLELRSTPGVTSEALLTSSAGVLRSDHWRDLKAILEDRLWDVRASELQPYLDRETQLRNAIAAGRAARAGTTYDRSAHPHHDYDARCDDVAAQAMQLADPLARELLLDRFRWGLLDELAGPAPYGVEAVLAYAVKLRLAEKWTAQVDAVEGLRVADGLAGDALRGVAL